MIETQEKMVLEPWQEDIVQEYYTYNAKKLYQMVDRILLKYGGITDHDEFYVLATDLFILCIKKFDRDKGNFDGFFYAVISRKIITAIRDKNRAIRSNTKQIIGEDGKVHYEFNPDISISTPIGDGDSTLEDVIEGDSDVNIQGVKQNDNVESYLGSLSNLQRRVVEMKMDGYSDNEVKEELELTDKRYSKLWMSIRSYEKTQHIHSNNNTILEDIKMENQIRTLETWKKDTIYVRMLMKKMDNHTVKFNHSLQRRSGRWTPIMRSKLVSDILQNNPLATSLVFAEQVVNGSAIIWDLDGKQKCTTIHQFIKNQFKISRKMVEDRRWNIKYDVAMLDDNGKELLDDDGYPMNEHLEFDIRGKYFKDLPDELKDRIEAYSFDVLQYFNCTEEDIAYHIERHNEGKQMNTCEKGLIKLGAKYASFVKDISDMSLFTELGEYTSSELNNGTSDRIVIEGIMAMKYLNNWVKNQDEICTYLKNNSKEEDFEEFEGVVSDLEELAEHRKEITNMFNSKNSFLWFALYSKFKQYGLDNNKFADFLIELNNSLHNKEIDGVTYDSLCFDENGKAKATKDKYIVVPKIELLENLMLDYLHIYIKEKQLEEPETEEISIIEFVRENVGQSIEQEDIELYEEILNEEDNGLKNLTFKVGIKYKVLDKQNEPSLVAIVAYSFKEDIIIDDWFKDYFKRNDTYLINQKENYIKMRDDLVKYMTYKENINISKIMMNGGKLACAM